MPRCPPAAAREDRRAGGLVPGEPPTRTTVRGAWFRGSRPPSLLRGEICY